MASSAAAAASGLRHHLSRTVSQPLLSFPLYRRRCNHSLAHRASFSLSGTVRFLRPCPHSLSAARPRRFLSALASASTLAARALTSSQRVPIEEDDLEYDAEDQEVREVLEVSPSSGEENEDEEDDDGGEEYHDVHGRVQELDQSELVVAEQQQLLPRFPSPNLSVKEKKELAAYAHSLGKKLKSQQVGKSGVTPSVVAAFVETLEVNELLKLKVHGSCPGELPDVIKVLEETTGSVAVGRIGRSVILYRPSLSKMKQNEAPTVKRTWRPKHKEPASGLRLQKKRPTQRSPGPRPNNIANKI